MISCYVEGFLEKSGIVTGEVLEEFSRDYDFSSNLCPTFRHDSLSQFTEEIKHLRFSHLFSNSEKNISIHVVSMDVSDRIMQSKDRYFFL